MRQEKEEFFKEAILSSCAILIDIVRFQYICFQEDLKAFASAIAPKPLIPIHTFEPNSYPKIFRNVRILNDGEVLDFAMPRMSF